MLDELFKMFPTKRIHPVDGMAITAKVWDDAHEYHRQYQRFFTLLREGSGILSGFEIIANDPPDTAVYILPGIAVDTWGQTVVVPEPRTYDVGTTVEGLIYILLIYSESPPQPDPTYDQEGAPFYVHAAYTITTTKELPDTPYVELARIRRENRTSLIHNAKIVDLPALNEIDLRFQRDLRNEWAPMATIGVHCLGNIENEQHVQGLVNLVKALFYDKRYDMEVDHVKSLDNNLNDYEIIYLAGHGSFSITKQQMTNLYEYLQHGGKLIAETYHRDAPTITSDAENSFMDLFDSLNIKLEKLTPSHSILHKPYLFAEAPVGYEPMGKVLIGNKVIFSTYDYAGLWHGQQRKTNPSRTDIRSAIEWGNNIFTFLMS